MFDTTQLRNVANELDLPLGRFAPGDELRPHQRAVLQAADEIDRLVNLLCSLPHARACLLRRNDQPYVFGKKCTCWKADEVWRGGKYDENGRELGISQDESDAYDQANQPISRRILSRRADAWDQGYERAEYDSDTGFWDKRLRSNPYRAAQTGATDAQQ